MATTALVAVTAFAPGKAGAQDSTWLPNPASGNYNDATNWNPATVPTGTASFGASNTTALTFSTPTDVGGWTFNPGASSYTFATNQSVNFTGAGIVVNGGSASLNINVGSTVGFVGASTAGSATINDNYNLDFDNFSTAGSAVITNGVHGDLRFSNFSTAGSATLNNSNTVFFFDNATPGDAAITNNGGAVVDFSGSVGPARDNRLTAGSIAGSGLFLLGDNELTVGGNNTSTDVSGAILGTGALVKVGGGTLTLSGNTNLGGTTIDAGTLAVIGGTLNASDTITLGSSAGSSGTLNIGAGGSATALILAVGLSGTGTLVLQDGGTLTDFGGFIGDLPGSHGTATVSGSASVWTSTGTLQVGAAGTGAGTLTIENGGRVNSDGGGSVGLSAGSTGTVTVTGPGSIWNNSPGGGLNIGSFGTGTLTISNGGTVINNTAFAANIGQAPGSQGTVTVTGAGSTWSNSSGTNIGNSGTGVLTIADGGIVTGPIVIAKNAGATGSLNIGAGPGDAAAAPGTVMAPSIAFGAGSGTLSFNHTSANYVFAPSISGNGAVNVLAGVTALTAANTYTGGTTIGAGTLQLGDGGTTGSIVGDVTDNGALAFNRSDTVTFPGLISGGGSVSQTGSGTTVLTGNNSYGGATSVSAGALFVNGDQSAATGATNVAAGATLGGVGVIGGNVSVANGGTLAPGGVGGGIGTLTIDGSLGLNSGSALNYSFGQPGAVGGPFNDLTAVKGDLTLAGTLNVALTPGGVFDPGVYRVISYAGALTDNGLLLGSVPPGTTEVVQTSVAHQVNLVNTTGVTLNYWDGAAAANKNNGVVDGGAGAWQNSAGNDNWTNATGALNAPWANAAFAIFEATPGTVTVDNSLGQVVASGMQFAVGGYTLTGEPITLAETAPGSGETVVRVGDGTAAGTGMTAIIASVLQGSTQLVKDDLGVLVLTGANTYAGGTTINAGTLQLGNGGTSGSILGEVVDNGTLAFNRSDIVTFAGGISGSGGVSQVGSGTTVLTGTNNYTGGTTINAGTLQLGDGGTTGSIVGDVVDNGTLAFNRSDTATFAGVISGGGAVAQIGPGATVLTGTNTYTGGTTIGAGTLQLGDGGTTGSIVGDVTDNGALAFNRSDTVTFPGLISGGGSVSQTGSGTTVLTGNNSYGGATSVSAGALFVNGDQSAATGATNVAAGATLGGVGVIGGNVSVANGGTLAPGGVGGGIGTLTIDGSLGLNSGSALNYSFGQPGAVGGPFNDLTAVKGDLTLAGTLNVALTPGGVFDPGVYRVISYAGALTDNGLLLGSVPPGTTEVVQTSVAHQVNLVNTTGVTLNYWDGAAAANKNNGVVDGGAGAWQNSAGNDNWTNATGALNAPWANAAFAIFEATPGTVTVDNSLGQVVASGMQFAVGGYTLTGEPITLAETAPGSGETVVRVGDGTAAGTGMRAIIASVLQGSTQLVKDDLGVLVLTGANTYAGGTTINAGTLQLGNGGTSGSILGEVVDNGTLAFNRSDIVTFAGGISGSGGVSQVGSGTTVLTGTNNYTGGTTINAGTLQLGDGGTTGSIVGDVVDNGTLAFNRSDTATFAGVISGGGAVAQIGPGATVLTGTNTYTGGTTIGAGTLQLGDGGTTGSIVGDVTDNGALSFNRSDTVTFPGLISGGGSVSQVGSGTTVLTGNNSYAGGTTISAGTLELGNGGTSGSIVGDVTDNGTLAFNRSDRATFAGVISGGGAVAQTGSGTAVLTGASTYTGGTTISAGTLQLGNGGPSGSIVGDVTNSGVLAFNRTDSVTFAGVISGGGAVSQVGSGMTVLTADSPFSGGTTISAGTLVVGDFAHPSAALSGGGPISVAHGATLGGYGGVTGSVVNDGVIAAGNATPGFDSSPTGAFTIVGNLLNRGAVRLASGVSIGNVLEVRGAYDGAGGTMAINTFLGGDGSPSDTLVINAGAATGGTSVQVINVGGPGVETTGDGILVVSAINGATTAPGAFVLAPGELRAGAFDYDLFHGGANGSNLNDWFLRSDFIVPPIQPPVVHPPGGERPEPPIPPEPPVQPLPPGVYPIIGPELATYGVVQPLARQLGETILGTLDDRAGDTYEQDCGEVARPASSTFCQPAVWGRLIGASIDNRYRAFADPRANGDLAGVQFGVDLLRGSLIAGQSDRAGLYGAYGDSVVDVDGLVTNAAATAYTLTHTGAAHLNAFSGGAYWTHVGPTGWYLDAVVQGTSYAGSAGTAFAKLSTDGWGFLASLEGGAPFALPQLGPGFVIEPQGQILWQEVSFEQRNDGLGDVALGDTTGPMGRVGLQGRWTIASAGGQVWQPYLRANLWEDWGAQANTAFGADIVGLSMRATLLQLGGGLTAKLHTNFSLFANADYEFGVGDTTGIRRDSVRGALGIRYAW